MPSLRLKALKKGGLSKLKIQFESRWEALEEEEGGKVCEEGGVEG